MMRFAHIALVMTLGSLTVAPAALAQGDAAAGQAKAAVCAACHGMDGNSVNPEWPSLAGQHANYTVAQLAAFKAGERQNALMSPMSMGLSEQDMQDLAAYYAAQAVKVEPVPPAAVERGRALYRLGDAKKEISACAACHGPAGRGNGPAQIPAISGQRSTYTAAQLKAYASGARKSTSEAKTAMMQLVAAQLSEADIAALAAYIQGLK